MNQRLAPACAIAVIFTIAILGLLTSAGSASAAVVPNDPGCDPRTPEEETPDCPTTKRIAYTQSCPKEGGPGICVNPQAAPIAELTCVVAYRSMYCEAWPQSDSTAYQYSWSTSGNITAIYSTDSLSPVGYADCTGNRGVVVVTVIAPGGAADSASAPVNCNEQ